MRAHLAGKSVAAIDAYRRVLAADPAHAAANNNLGTLLAAQGDHVAAEQHFRTAIRTQDDYGEAWNNLGILLSGVGSHNEAVRAFTRATTLEPGKPAWQNNLGNALVEVFRFPDALQAYDRALALDDRVSDYWSNRGLALRGLRRATDAIASLEQATKLDPAHLNALSNLGVLYKEERRFAEAHATFERAHRLSPSNAVLLCNHASVCEREGDWDRLRTLVSESLRADPFYPEALNLLANAELEAARYSEAESLYHQVIQRDPQNRNANWNLALIWLLRGDFERGWRQFEWRKRLQSVVFDHGDYGPNEWDGSPLAGRSILLHSEQGMGDAIQFIRYAELLKGAGAGRITLEAPWPILPLLAGVAGVDATVARGAPLPEYDLHANLLSLPGLMGTTLATVPARVPYIPVERRPVTSTVEDTGDAWRVGIVWAGNPVHARDALRSAPLASFVALQKVKGPRWFSLQKGGEAEAELTASGAEIIDLAPSLADFRDTASAIEALDLVITVDTSVAHLAGALGKCTWLLLPHVPDFRWMLDRADSPWYPSMRIFRQAVPKHWDGVFREVHQALRELTSSPPSRRTPTSAGDVVTLVGQGRLADGRPRFDLTFPLPLLASPDLFAEYEAELLGINGGASRASREFLRELLPQGAIYIDAIPGLGLCILDGATAGSSPARITVVGPPDEVQRIGAAVALRAPGTRVTGASDLTTALDRARASGDSIIARIHAASLKSTNDWRGVDVVVVERINESVAIDKLSDAGFELFALSWHGEAVLDPVESGVASTVVAMRPSVLQRLEGASPAAAPARRVLGIDWELRSDTGWGVYGINLTLELARRGNPVPAVFGIGPLDLNPLARARLRTVGTEDVPALLHGADARQAVRDGILLQAMGNGFTSAPADPATTPRRRVGVVFLEDTNLDHEAIRRASEMDLIVAGSTWNAGVIRARGVERVEMVMQGIDPSIFHRAPRSGLFPDRFVVFSGGKLEYRKGQDIVIAAFREFGRRHPDALLVVGWHNAWPHLMSDLELAGHVRGQPAVQDGSLAIVPWLVANGIAESQIIDAGRQSNALMGQLVREADVAVFPNRCEGGTNLVAMECMAAGVPTIVSRNTGHLDLVGAAGCASFERQGTVPRPTRYFGGTEGWGETAAEEVIELLEKAYTDSAWREALSNRGADAMSCFTWRNQVTRLVDVLAPLW